MLKSEKLLNFIDSEIEKGVNTDIIILKCYNLFDRVDSIEK